MQTVSSPFTTASLAPVRTPQVKVEASWDKAYATSSGYFTIGVSLIGGTDIIPGDGYVANDFELFVYEDDTAYVMSVQVDRFLNEPTSVARAALDVVLDNTSHYFDLNGTSSIAGLVQVGKPMRISVGFGGTYVNIFNGVISDYPTFNTLAATVELFGFDLTDLISGIYLEDPISLTNVTVDQVLVAIFAQLGIASSNYNFGVGALTIPDVELDTVTLIGQIINDLMVAEGGYFWLDETGKWQFLPRNLLPYAVPNFDISGALVLNAEDLITTYIYNTCQVTGADSDGNPIYSTYQDFSSIAIFGPQVLQISNPYIQTQTAADGLAFLYVQSNGNLEAFHVLTIVGIPQLQLGDVVTWNNASYVIIRAKTMFNPDSGLTQEVTIKRYTLGALFTIGTSLIGGTSQIAP